MSLKVAVLGPLGTYTHEAAHSKFSTHATYEEQPTIADVFHVLSESVQLGVVPQENTIFGNVIETYDILRKSNSNFIRGEVVLKVSHCLLVRKGVKLHEIKKVMSHEQALGQCQAFLTANLPGVTTIKMPSTASAARALLENPPDCAAICSRICSTLFNGLEVIAEGIQNDAVNFTRFFVLAHKRDTYIPPQFLELPHKIALFRITPSISRKSNRLGCSGEIMQILNALALKITRIDRRPSVNLIPFQDVYFVEAERSDLSSLCVSDSERQGDWSEIVDNAMQRVQAAGGEANLVGIW